MFGCIFACSWFWCDFRESSPGRACKSEIVEESTREIQTKQKKTYSKPENGDVETLLPS